MFEIELFWHLTVCKQKTILILNWTVWNRTVLCIKMDLALITYYDWCAIRSTQTKPLFGKRFNSSTGTQSTYSILPPPFLLDRTFLPFQCKYLFFSTEFDELEKLVTKFAVRGLKIWNDDKKYPPVHGQSYRIEDARRCSCWFHTQKNQNRKKKKNKIGKNK